MAFGAENIEPGIYFGLDENVYHRIPALSCSGMKKLAVSPLHYWHTHFNPAYETADEADHLRYGKAIHCLLLEPDAFAERFARKITADDYPGCLVTVDDMKEYLGKMGLPVTAKRKQDLIDRIQKEVPEPAMIWDVEKDAIARGLEGKTLLNAGQMQDVERLRLVIDDEPFVRALLSGGMPEVSIIVRDPENGVLLKARLDYARTNATVDVKTFSNSREKPTDRAVFGALYYESYHLQTRVYHHVRELARQQLASGQISTHGNVPEYWIKGFTECVEHGFGFVFIESEAPHDLRILEMRAREAAGGAMNVYWSAADLKMREMIALYSECMERYGTERPWREPQQPRVVNDTDLPQLIFAS